MSPPRGGGGPRSGARLVCVDVFDTLLVRLVPSEAVVARAARDLAARIGDRSLTPADLLGHRAHFARAAERARREWSVRQWLDALARAYALDVERTVAAGLDVEHDAEHASTAPRREVLASLAAVRTAGARAVAVSDTWHDRAALSRLLAAHGIELDAVYSSCTEGVSKRRGSLFGHVLAAEGIAAHEAEHWGDSWKADGVRAVAARIAPRPVQRPIERAPSLLADRVPEAAVALTPPGAPDPDPLAEGARSLLAPMLAAAAIAHEAELRRRGIADAVYLARDAWPLLHVAERVAPLMRSAVQRHYVRTSRRALSLAHPDDLLQAAGGLAGKFGKRTVGELLAPFDLRDELYAALLRDAGLEAASAATPPARAALRAACARHAHAIAAAQHDQRALVRDLFEQTLGAVPSRLALIDSGWAGTSQDAIAASLGDNVTVLGLYLGVGRGALPSRPGNEKRGLLWDAWAGLAPLDPLERSAGVVRVWDRLLREPHASVRRLRRASGGRVEPELASPPAERELDAARRIAAGIERGLDEIESGLRALLDAYGVDAPLWTRAARALACALTTRPSPAFAQAVLDLDFDEGAIQGRAVRVDLRGLGDGLVWIPGVAASLGVGAGVIAASTALDVAERVGRALRRP